MIKIRSIKRIQLKNGITKINIYLSINNIKYSFFYKLKDSYLPGYDGKCIDFIMPILFCIGYFSENDLDLNGFFISKKTLIHLKKINQIYNDRYHKNKLIKIFNINITDKDIQKNNNKALFFSLGVDSFYTLYKTQIKNLIFIHGFDIKYKDNTLFNTIKKQFTKFCNDNSYNPIFVQTNLREITEQFCHRNYIFGAALASVGLLMHYNKYYISSWMEDEKGYPWGSHKDIDYLRGNGLTEFVHYGAGINRLNKIKFISNYNDIYKYLRVCWKNYNNSYNCGTCEKCIRTMLDFFLIGKLTNFNCSRILPTKLDIQLLNHIEINEANYLYYETLIKNPIIKENEEIYKIIKKKLDLYTPNSNWTKNKNIIFIDFNGVISYKNFWFSLELNDIVTYEKINEFLFGENIELVKKWMLGKYKSSDICKFISEGLHINYNYIYNILITDCKNIDLSKKIREILQELKKYYKIVLVTDNMDCFSNFTVKYNSDYFQIFDGIFNSAEKGYFKVDEYKNYIETYNSNINLCYLIDDSANNCKKFQDLGGNTLNVKGEKYVIKSLQHILKQVKTKRTWQF